MIEVCQPGCKTYDIDENVKVDLTLTLTVVDGVVRHPCRSCVIVIIITGFPCKFKEKIKGLSQRFQAPLL